MLPKMAFGTDCRPPTQTCPASGNAMKRCLSRIVICTCLLFSKLSVADANDCLDSTKVGEIGSSGECAGMLIVNRGMLDAAKTNGTYAITGPDGNVYTFGDSQYNVFTGQVTKLDGLFRNTDFNADIGYWDVSAVTDFTGMFQFNPYFNQDLSGWDVSNKTTSLRGIFNHSGAADQDLSGWDVSNVTDFFAAFGSDHSKWSPANYDATLNAWSNLQITATSLQPFAFYTAASSAARSSLIEQGWTFDRDSLTEDTTPPSLTSSPANGATAVAVDSDILLSFNEPVTWLGGEEGANGNTVELVRSSDDHVVQIFSVDNRPVKSSFTLSPSDALEPGTDYYIRINPITFYDLSNNPFSGIDDKTSLAFQTQSLSAPVPAFNTAASTANGFTIQISNYDAAFTWSATTTAGTAAVNSSGLITITGLLPAESATLTASTSRAGYSNSQASVTAAALQAALTPAFGTPTRTSDGFSVVVSNFDAAFDWSVIANAGTTSIDSNGLITVTGVEPGTSSTATVSTTRTGYADGSATVTNTALLAALTPAFGTSTRTPDGFSVPVSNYDAAFDWSVIANAGTVSIDSNGLITVIGIEPGTSSTATVSTIRTGHANGQANVTAAALEAALTPTFGMPTLAADGFSIQINNYDAVFDWSIIANAGTASIDGNGLITVTGIEPGASSTATVSTTRTGYSGGSATITNTALLDELTPAFKTPTLASNGFSVQISNYDAAFAWSATTSAGTATINGSGLVAIIGLGPGESATVTVSTTRANHADGQAMVSAEVDTDDDGIPDSQDAFPYAKSKQTIDGVTLTTTPASSGSECGITRLSVDDTSSQNGGTAFGGVGIAVDFTLSGCSTETPETIEISIDLGTLPAKDSVAYKIDATGAWTVIENASIIGSLITYRVTDNDGVLDQNGEQGVITDPMTVAVPMTATALPVPTLTPLSFGLLWVLLGLLGSRRLHP